mmetsp:Transcript_12615/g.17227  ORF Transcript_12615/g.17227 Transcript_12615/m.17227 type:complete len:136 (+) Transcript_12615:404-811(+)
MCYSRICAVASHVAGFMLNPLSTGCWMDGRIIYQLQTKTKSGGDMSLTCNFKPEGSMSFAMNVVEGSQENFCSVHSLTLVCFNIGWSTGDCGEGFKSHYINKDYQAAAVPVSGELLLKVLLSCRLAADCVTFFFI